MNVTSRVSHRSHPTRRREARPTFDFLEDRQVLSWSGVPPFFIPPPGNAVPVALDSQNDAQGTAAVSANENDFYSFTAPVTGTYVITATTPNSNLDTVLGLYARNGIRLAYNDDIAANDTDSRVTVTLIANSRYYFGITNYTGAPNGAYSWSVDGPTPTTPPPTTDDTYEDNDSRTQAASLGTITAPLTISNLVMADSADWFSFTTTAAGTAASSVAISFQHVQGDLDLQLYSATGQLLRASEGTSNSETVSLDGLAAGTYFVRAYGYLGASNPNYSLIVTPPTSGGGGGGGGGGGTTGDFDIVVRVSGLSFSQRQVFEQAAARWEQIIVGDVPDANYRGTFVDDILIDASARFIDGVNGILGQAGPDAFRSGSYLPIHGVMQFDSADLSALERSGLLYDVILHEMGHVLGIGTIWQALGLLTGAGSSNPRFTGANATQEYNAIFGASGNSVPVEGNSSPVGSRDSHWRESVFGNELMSPYVAGPGNPISRVTVASLDDIGYTVDLDAADAFTPNASARAAARASVGRRASLIYVPTSATNPFASRPLPRAWFQARA